MVDYYQIMGLKPDASSTAIRSAYKKLAMLYHPDRNPNNPQAEELFKVINEAYQVLSDPIKKQQYDLRYHGLDNNIKHSSAHDRRAYWREYHHKQYEHWRQSQQSTYQFDKRYFKIQGLAIVTFLTIAGICFLFINIVQYFQEQQIAEQTRQNNLAIQEVHSLFNEGKKKEAFTLIRNLQKQQPHEYSFYFTEDTLLINLHNESEKLMQQAKFDLAMQNLLVLKDYEDPVSINTLQNLATCDIHTGNYSSALVSLQNLLEQQPERVSLLLSIAIIYQDKLMNLVEAEKYLTMGKKLFKLRMIAQYGEAFQLVADPNDISQVYYDIFIRRLQVNLQLKRFDEAEKDGNWAIYLRPQNAEGYYWRAQAEFGNKNKSQACADLKQARVLGFKPEKELFENYCR